MYYALLSHFALVLTIHVLFMFYSCSISLSSIHEPIVAIVKFAAFVYYIRNEIGELAVQIA